MFGSPIPLPGLGSAPLTQLQNDSVPNLPQIDIPHKAGMFAQGGVGRNIAGLIGDFLMQRAGMHPLFGPMLQQRQQQALEEQQYQRHRADKQADWQQQYDYEAAHPKAPNNDTANDFAFWQQHLSPEDFKAWVHNKVDPPQFMQVPGVGIVQIPRGAPQGAPTAPVGKLTPLGAGGPSPQGSGGFL